MGATVKQMRSLISYSNHLLGFGCGWVEQKSLHVSDICKGMVHFIDICEP